MNYRIGIDTSSANFIVLVLFCEEKLVSTFSGPCHLESDLIIAIDKLLKTNNLTIEQINMFLLGQGPGSFMSLRIGFSVIRTWAWLFKIPMQCVSSLDLLAQSHPEYTQSVIVPCIDAKMGKVFANIHKNTKKIFPDQDICPKDLVSEICKINGPIIIVGSGATILQILLKSSSRIKYLANYLIAPRGFLHTPIENLTFSEDTIKQCLPNYMRRSHAEIEKDSKAKLT